MVFSTAHVLTVIAVALLVFGYLSFLIHIFRTKSPDDEDARAEFIRSWFNATAAVLLLGVAGWRLWFQEGPDK